MKKVRPNTKERTKQREAFVYRHIELFANPTYDYEKRIVELARKELGYSPATYWMDIMRALEIIYYAMMPTLKPDYDTELPARYSD